MLRRDLLEILQSERAWAFVGSGGSVDAGGDTWRDLVEAVVDGLESAAKEAVLRMDASKLR